MIIKEHEKDLFISILNDINKDNFDEGGGAINEASEIEAEVIDRLIHLIRKI